MKKLVFLLIITITASVAFGQQSKKKNVWKTLGKVTFKKEYDEVLGMMIEVPVFSKPIKALENKTIEVKGYIIPTEGYKNHKEFVFSAFPYNMCFFCGGAGPETVMAVYADNAIEYTDKMITIKGKLSLQTDIVSGDLMYALHDVVLVD